MNTTPILQRLTHHYLGKNLKHCTPTEITTAINWLILDTQPTENTITTGINQTENHANQDTP